MKLRRRPCAGRLHLVC